MSHEGRAAPRDIIASCWRLLGVRRLVRIDPAANGDSPNAYYPEAQMADGSSAFGEGLLKMFEERFGPRLTKALLALLALAAAAWATQVIWSVVVPPLIWLWNLIRPLLPSPGPAPFFSPDGIERLAPYAVVAAKYAVTLAITVQGYRVITGLVHQVTLMRETQEQVTRALNVEGRRETTANQVPTLETTHAIGGEPEQPETLEALDVLEAPDQSPRAVADTYAEQYLQPGLKRLVELRNPALPVAAKQESAARLRLLWEAVRADLRRDFGPAVELRFNFGQPYMRLGMSAVDDYEARWIELKDIVRDMRNGSL